MASRWSRRVVAMLPWLVFPLTLIWSLSQILPPDFRFEITSPRLACVGVLFASLLWYEVLMPKLYSWRDRQRAMLKERKHIEARETAKRRKEATRRCRNCFTAYKDQTPAGGRFMCTFCGHVSKRPVLDVPVGAPSAGSSFLLAGAAAGFVTWGTLFSSRSSKMWNTRGAQERSTGGGHSWTGDRPWIDGGTLGVNGSWSAGAWPGSPLYFGSGDSGWAGLWNFSGGGALGQEKCHAGESDFRIFWLVLRFLLRLLFFLGSMWCKLCRVGFSVEDGMCTSHHSCHSSGEYAGPSPETRGEKARRKAEEKRIARFEKEQLEVEERKQREEVARLVEERRRQRDQKLEAEKEATAEMEHDGKREKEAEKQPLEKKREKLQSKEKAKEQETEEQKKRKGKDVEKNKIAKGTKLDTTPKGSEVGPKIPFSSRSGSSKDAGFSARTGFFSKSKNVAASINSATSFWGRSLSADSKHLGQSSKAVLPPASSVPSTSNPITASTKKPGKISDSAWNRIHWSNVWGKAGSKVPNEMSGKLVVVENTDKILESSATDDVKCLVDGAIVSPSAAGSFRQPIAPPSSSSDLRDNLFSGPIGFPPVQLPVDSAFQKQRQVQAGNMIHFAPYSSSCFLGSSCPASCPSTQFLRSCTCSDDMSPRLDSLPSSVSSSLKMINYTGIEFDYLSTSPLSNSVNGLGTISSPLSSLTVSSSITATGIEGLEFRNAKQENLFQSLEPLNIRQGSFPSETASGDSSMENLWHNWSAPLPPLKDFAQPRIWDAHCNQNIDPLHLSHPPSLQPNLEQKSHLASSIFFMENKDGCPGRSCIESSRSLPELDGNVWKDLPKLDSIIPDSEDAAMSQGGSPEFVDCITHSLKHDPVLTANGHSFERSATEAWLKFEPHEMSADPFQSTSAAGSAWLGRDSMARPPPRDFYPSPGVKSFWSYNNIAG